MIKKTLPILILFPLVAMGISESELTGLKKRLDQDLENSKVARSQLGLYVGLGGEQETKILEVQSNKQMLPASVTKLVTAAATLHSIPPGTKLKTQLLLDLSQVEERVLKGDLHLKGAGDPGFVSETMWFLVNSFLRNRITKIDGNIIVDDTLFDKSRFDESRQKERVDRAYDAPTGAMSFNWNSVNIFVRPGKRVGDPAVVFVDPENDYIKLESSVTTVGPGKGVQVDLDRIEQKDADVIKARGKISISEKEKVIFASLTKPDLWSGENLKSFLKQRGISVLGKVIAGKVTSKLSVVAEAESKPIEHMVSDMNKFSNNYVAEMLTKNIAVADGKIGSIENGMKSLHDIMKKAGVESDQYVLTNPSGLNRDNRISAYALWKVLEMMKEDYRYQPEFVTSLPIAGVDGTLKNRMKSSPGERWVRAKTGLLDGVVALAGFAGRKDGTVIPFVFIFNGSADEGRVRSLFDQLAMSLVK